MKLRDKKKFPMNTLSTETLRHPMRANDKVVRVVAKVPKTNAVYAELSIAPQNAWYQVSDTISQKESWIRKL
ncbi:hypothetical protein EG329_013455 [Mollisiaceae sp. DMI_Dod_QoI]|nr:hypothetical protein EG329_013455 [Helotiales sp. DMI_Dod_QoI]